MDRKRVINMPDAQTDDEKSVYQENIVFWENAWNMVKNPYTQLPKLDYLPNIPSTFTDHKVKDVLDLGCGSGWLSIYLAREGFQVVGVDVAPQAINLAKTWAAQENLPITFDIQDLAELDYPEARFHGVVANSIFEHFTINQTRVMVNKVHELLTNEGIFIGCFDKVGGGPGEYFCLPDGTHVYTDKARKGMLLRRYTREELEELFQAFSKVDFSIVDGESLFVRAYK
jgi:SAM-dependent methyltransferase